MDLEQYTKVAAQYESARKWLKENAADVFKSERSRLELSQRALADKLGVTWTYISKIENGHMEPGDDLVARFWRLTGAGQETS